ncbi:MAG: hypothetical protein IJ466_11885 [Clostridia bacterium]|nr:hypothetical protein [Clostridia bacterium]
MTAVVLIIIVVALFLFIKRKPSSKEKESPPSYANWVVTPARQYPQWSPENTLQAHVELFAKIGEYTYKSFPPKSANLKIINYNGFSGTDISFYDHGETLKWCHEAEPAALSYLEKICSVRGNDGKYQYDYESSTHSDSEFINFNDQNSKMLKWVPEEYLECIRKHAPHACVKVKYLHEGDPIMGKGYCIDIYFGEGQEG